MLKDLRELFDEDEKEFETLEDARRRTIIIAGAIGGGLLLVVLLCAAGYSLLIGPRRTVVRQTQLAENQTQIAGISQDTSEEPGQGIPAEASLQPAPTRTRLPSPTLSPTIEPSSTPTNQPAVTPTRRPSSPTPTGTATPTPAPSTTPEVVFQEDFEGSGGAWPSAAEDTYIFGTTAGGFRIFVNTTFIDIWTVRDREFTDVRLELDVAKTTGPDDGFAGLICRFQNSGNYYGFVISGDGTYRIYKKSGGVITDLGVPAPGEYVRSGNTENRIRADCTGTELIFYINGEKVVETQDTAYSEGRVGLVVGTQSTPGLDILFDNFLIANP